MRRIVLVRVVAAILLALTGAGISACVDGQNAPGDPGHPGGGFGNTGRGFTYGRG
jgi:hypothetical protein